MIETDTNSSSALEQDLCARFERSIIDGLDADPHLIWRGRDLTADCVVQIGNIPFLLRIEQGRIREYRKGLPLLCSWVFAVRGSAPAWAALWQDPPPPGWHDVFALAKRGEMSLEGNLQPLMANLQYIKDVVALPRKQSAKSPLSARLGNSSTTALEPIVGRYTTIRIMENDCRIYFEEAGQGIPLVCLHTAGADSRQFRQVLCDEAVTKNFRV